MSYIVSLWQSLVSTVKTISLFDIVDIALVAFVVYKGIALIRGTRAAQLIKGILILAVSYFVAAQLNLQAMKFLLVNVFQYGVFALLVVFQPELRRILEQVGRSGNRLRYNLFAITVKDAEKHEEETRTAIKAVCSAAVTLQKTKTGALVVFENVTKLGEIIKTGTVIDAAPMHDLLCNIFFPNSPLHDGAVIISDGRVYAAGCFLPLSQNQQISRELGTRHRAALGMSENSDALVVIVSEETGVISLAKGGVLQRNLTADTLRTALERGLLPKQQADKKKRGLFGRRRPDGKEKV